MATKIKLHLTKRKKLELFIYISLLILLCVPGATTAAEDMKPVPIENVAASPLNGTDEVADGLVIVELFSSQACVFCPKADRLFSELLTRKNIFGIACHVDYFDVEQGALSRPFCTARQGWYMDRLLAGPHYTPQMVVNGKYDIIGYKIEMVKSALQKAGQAPVKQMELEPLETGGDFRLTLPPAGQEEAPRRLWMMLYDKTHELTIAGGRNKGKNMVYDHIVSAMHDLGIVVQGTEKLVLNPALTAAHKGFIVLLQNDRTGAILGAVNYEPASNSGI